MSRAHERYRQTTDDRQTDRRQTDGRAIAYSEREREFTFAKNESKHSEIGPVRLNPMQRTVRSVHMCVHCRNHQRPALQAVYGLDHIV